MTAALVRIAIVALLAGAVSSSKQPPWEKKEYSSWTDKECKQVLSTSPWVVMAEFSRASSMKRANSRYVNPNTGSAGAPQIAFDEKEITTIFEFRLVTAKPIKMAFARMMTLSDPSNQALKEQVTQMVAQKESNIVFHITYVTSPNDKKAQRDLEDYFTRATLADFRGNTFLQAASDSPQVPIVDYWAPDPQRPNPAFVFPRSDPSGKPFFSGEEESITLHADLTPKIKDKSEKYEVRVKVSPPLMKYQGQFEM